MRNSTRYFDVEIVGLLGTEASARGVRNNDQDCVVENSIE